MNRDTISKLQISFNSIVNTWPDSDVEFWFARDLQPALGYDQWRNFQQVVRKAETACTASGSAIGDHFRDVTKVVRIGSGAEREIEDVMLTRCACYLIAQNGDPRKEQIAFAQSYFAIQTRKQELVEERLHQKTGTPCENAREEAYRKVRASFGYEIQINGQTILMDSCKPSLLRASAGD